MQPRVDVYGEKRRTTRTRKEGQHRALETEATMPQEPSESSPRLTQSRSVGACAPASQASALTQAIGSAPVSPSACSATSSAGCGESRIDEKRDALDRWAKRLHDIVERPPGNVVELRAVAV